MKPSTPWWGSVALFGAAVLSACGCHRESPRVPSSRPSVILITVDTLRPDRLSCYGYQGQQTPAIDALARDGVQFDRAMADVPWTTASMASVFTGQYASRHQLRLSTERLSDRAVTLAEILRQESYVTGAVVGSFPVASIYNLNQGFDHYDEDFTAPLDRVTPGEPFVDLDGQPRRIRKVAPRLTGSPEELQRYFAEKAANDACRPDAEVTDRAATWLRAHGEGDFFLWVHYFGPHERVNILQPWREQWPRVIAEYDRDLAETDRQVGRLLAAVDELGLRQRTLVILHADHGQSLGEDDYVGHGDNLYPASLRIPLLMRLPGRVAAGRRIACLTENVDILPTVLGLLRMTPPGALSGVDLSSQLVNPSVPPCDGQRLGYAETFASLLEPQAVQTAEYGPLSVRLTRFGVLRDDRMYVLNQFEPPCARAGGESIPDEVCKRLSKEELFDPFAIAPVAARDQLLGNEQLTAAWFRDQLSAYQSPRNGSGEPVELSPEQEEKLRVLGYGSDS